MNEIRVEYLHEGKPYRLNGNRFDYSLIMSITKSLQEQYMPFADKIDIENGYIEINLSDSDILKDGIHHEAVIKSISQSLRNEIQQSFHSDY